SLVKIQMKPAASFSTDSVILPCNTTPDLPEDTTVEWTRSDLGLITVHEYSNRNDDLMTQDEVYRDRTKMSEDPLRTGDLSLTLKHPTERDTGRYICTIYRDKDILTQKVVLSEIFFLLLHRTISILVQSFSGFPGSPGLSPTTLPIMPMVSRCLLMFQTSFPHSATHPPGIKPCLRNVFLSSSDENPEVLSSLSGMVFISPRLRLSLSVLLLFIQHVCSTLQDAVD
uniref:Ig-like domain-containing protein n=1 Tax=Neolamprologus brichardi TaxID=32507 RepID=A0A3Q4I812_NEOBR